MEKEIFEGLEEARQDFNSWQGCAAIYIDFEDMTAWTHVGDLPIYRADSIVVLVSKDDLFEPNEKYGKKELNRIARAKIKMKEDGCSLEQMLSFYYMYSAKYL